MERCASDKSDNWANEKAKISEVERIFKTPSLYQTLVFQITHKTISAEMAVRLGKFCGNGPGLWLRMQQAHDLWHAERAMAEVVKTIPTARAA